MSYVTQNATKSLEPRAITISTAIEDFDGVLDRASGYADRLQKLRDRIHGPQPKEVTGTPKGDASPQSVISAIHERRSRFVDILNWMESSIDGLEAGL